MIWRLHSALAAIFIVLTLPLWALMNSLTVRLGGTRQRVTRQIRAWMKFVSGLYGLRYEIEYPADWSGGDDPCLVVFNHQSLFDIPAVYEAYPGDLRMLAKQELFEIPVFGRTLLRTGHVPVNQRDAESRRRSIDRLREIARQGYHVCVMPEGARSETRVPGLFRRGTFQMAIELGLEIRLIALLNTIEVCHRTTLWARPRVKVRVKVLEKIRARDWPLERVDELAALARAKIVEALELSAEERGAAKPVPATPALKNVV